MFKFVCLAKNVIHSYNSFKSFTQSAKVNFQYLVWREQLFEISEKTVWYKYKWAEVSTQDFVLLQECLCSKMKPFAQEDMVETINRYYNVHNGCKPMCTLHTHR